MKKVVIWGHKKLAGFSLLELMVVVAILGVLATVAVPRFNIFRARARQSEAKSNLGVVFTLQEAFNIDNEQYYDGDHNVWGGTNMAGAANRDGYFSGGSSRCSAADANNKLGFRLANCDKSRFGYYIAGGSETDFLAVAFAPSDTTGEKRIFPGCNGQHPATAKRAAESPTNVRMKCSGTHNANTSHAEGDAWCIDESRNLENYRDITEFCNQ